MTELEDARPTPAERFDDIPRILEALRLAVEEALLDHKLAGNPIAVWRNGRVEWVQPEDIPIEDPLRRKE
jgi:hypothetical protein